MTALTKGESFDLLADHLAMFEADAASGLISWVSKPLGVMFGYVLAGELEDVTVETLVPVAMRDAHEKVRVAYAADPEPKQVRWVSGQRKDGSVFPCSILLLPRSVLNKWVVLGVVTPEKANGAP